MTLQVPGAASRMFPEDLRDPHYTVLTFAITIKRCITVITTIIATISPLKRKMLTSRHKWTLLAVAACLLLFHELAKLQNEQLVV